MPVTSLYLDCAPFIGGAQESLCGLLHADIAAGNGTHVLCASQALFHRLEPQESAQFYVSCIPCRHWRLSMTGVMQFCIDRFHWKRAIRNAIRSFQPDVIHCNTVRAALLLPSARELATCRIVIHDRDLRIPAIVVRHLAKTYAPEVIAVSRAVSEKWHRYLEPSRLTVVPNAILAPDGTLLSTNTGDCAGLCLHNRLERTGDRDERILGLVADFVPWKNHAAFVRVVQAIPNARGIIVGRVRDKDGERYRASIESMIQTSHARVVIYDGCAPDDDNAVDVLLSVTREEPFGRTVLEALGKGIPVIAMSGGGMDDVLANQPNARVVSSETELIEAVRESLA